MMAVHTSVLWMAPLFNYQFLNKDQKIFVCFVFFLLTIFHPWEMDFTWVRRTDGTRLLAWRIPVHTMTKCYYFHLSLSLGSIRDWIQINRSCSRAGKANCTLATHRGALHSLTPASRSRAEDYSVSAGAIESGAAFPFNSPLIRSPASNWLPNFSIRNQQ